MEVYEVGDDSVYIVYPEWHKRNYLFADYVDDTSTFEKLFS